MSAYIVAMIEITDPQGYADYRAQTPDLIAKYGGFAAVSWTSRKVIGLIRASW